MGFAYSTGVPTGPSDLLQKLVAFLAANGWTTNMSQAEGSGWRAHMQKGSIYVNLRAAVNEVASIIQGYWLAGYVGEWYNSAVGWKAQAGGPVQSGSSTINGCGIPLVNAGPYVAYHFFQDDNDNVLVVLERTAGIFSHIGFGTLTKAGAYTGGQYFVGTLVFQDISQTSNNEGISTTTMTPGVMGEANAYPTGYFRADVDSWTGKWLSLGDSTNAGYGWTGKKAGSPIAGQWGVRTEYPAYGTNWQNHLTSDMNGKACMMPVQIYAERDATPGGWSLLGALPSIRFTNATTAGFTNGQEETIGTEVWKIFPNFAVRKS